MCVYVCMHIYTVLPGFRDSAIAENTAEFRIEIKIAENHFSVQ